MQHHVWYVDSKSVKKEIELSWTMVSNDMEFLSTNKGWKDKVFDSKIIHPST